MKEIFYKKSGQGRPLILIHGFCEDHEIWDAFAEPLARHSTVYAIDLPGFGASPLLKTPFSIDDIAKLILQWMDEIKISDPIVIGHSLGGYVALAMAAHAPGRLSALGLFHSTAFEDTAEKKMNRTRVMEFVQKHGVDPFVDTFVPGLYYNKNHPAITAMDKIARKANLGTLLGYTAAMRDRPSYSDVFIKLTMPVLVLGGDQDSIIPREITEKHGVLHPGAIVRILNSTGHMAMFEDPTASQKVILEFIRA